MASFTVTFNANNSAFDDGEQGRGEISDILHALSEVITDSTALEGKIRDSNGNHIGSWRYETNEDPKAAAQDRWFEREARDELDLY